MSRTRFEQIPAELIGDAGRYVVRLDITVIEQLADESARPLKREVDKVSLASRAGAPDGNYTLRYSFDGKQKEELVRLEALGMLAGHR
jgi:hypothetical protein